LLEQFTNPLIFVLLGAAILSFIFKEQLEAFAILIVIGINTAIVFFMELQANRSMEALQKLSKHRSVVLRDGEVQSVDSTEIVVGDIIVMEAGEIVPADARIIAQHNLGVNESALSGESNQVSKSIEAPLETTSLTERKNALFKGTIISRENSNAVVTHIGKNTELGKKLVVLTLVLATIVMVVGIIEGRNIYLMVKTAIALAIAAILRDFP
jgi:Ca2+-transporting ATPase